MSSRQIKSAAAGRIVPACRAWVWGSAQSPGLLGFDLIELLAVVVVGVVDDTDPAIPNQTVAVDRPRGDRVAQHARVRDRIRVAHDGAELDGADVSRDRDARDG